MKRLLFALLALIPLSANAADAIIHADAPGQTLYVRIRLDSSTSVAYALTEGASEGVGFYYITDATLEAPVGPLDSAGIYPYKIFVGTESETANDPQVGEGVLYWSGTASLPQTANATYWKGTALAAVDTAGYPKVTIKDGTGTGEIDTNAGGVAHVILADTITTYTGNTPQTGDNFALVGAIKTKTDFLPSVLAGTAGGLLTTDSTLEGTIDVEQAFYDATADAIWDETITGHAGVNSTGLTLSNRASQTSVNAIDDYVDTEVLDILNDTGTSGVIVATVNDKDGYRLSNTGVDDIWDEPTSGHLTDGRTGKALVDGGAAGDPWSVDLDPLPAAYVAGTAGYILKTNLDATVSTIKTKTDFLPSITAGNSGGVLIAGTNAATTFASLTSTGAFSINGVSNVAQTGDSFARIGATGSGLTSLASSAGVTVTTNNDKTGYTLSDAGIDSIWNEDLSTGHTTAGSLPTLLPDAGDQIAGEDAVVNLDLDGIADAVWDETRTGHTGADTFGLYLDQAISGVGSIALTQEQIDDFAATIVTLFSAVYTPVSADIVGDSYTWNAVRNRATNIVEVENGYVGPLALKPDMNPGVSINTVDSVSIVSGVTTVTATNLAVDRSRTKAQWTVPALNTEGTYTVRVKVTTIENQQITTTATMKVL